MCTWILVSGSVYWDLKPSQEVFMRSQSKIQCAVEETSATLYQVWGIQLPELLWGLSKPKNHTVHRENTTSLQHLSGGRLYWGLTSRDGLLNKLGKDSLRRSESWFSGTLEHCPPGTLLKGFVISRALFFLDACWVVCSGSRFMWQHWFWSQLAQVFPW